MAHGIEVRQSDGASFFRTDTAALFHVSSLEVGNPSVGNWEAIRFRPDVNDGSAGQHYIHFLATTSPGTDYLLPHVTYYAAMEVPLESVLFAHVYLEPTRNDHGGNVGWSLSWGRGEDVVYPNGETNPGYVRYWFKIYVCPVDMVANPRSWMTRSDATAFGDEVRLGGFRFKLHLFTGLNFDDNPDFDASDYWGPGAPGEFQIENPYDLQLVHLNGAKVTGGNGGSYRPLVVVDSTRFDINKYGNRLDWADEGATFHDVVAPVGSYGFSPVQDGAARGFASTPFTGQVSTYTKIPTILRGYPGQQDAPGTGSQIDSGESLQDATLAPLVYIFERAAGQLAVASPAELLQGHGVASNAENYEDRWPHLFAVNFIDASRY